MVTGTLERRAGVLVSTVVASIMITDGLIGLLQPSVFASDMASDGWGSETLFPVAMLALPEIINVALGVGAWGGLWLRDTRLRGLLPLRLSNHGQPR